MTRYSDGAFLELCGGLQQQIDNLTNALSNIGLALDVAAKFINSINNSRKKYQPARLCYEQALSIGDRVGLQNHFYYLTARQLLQTCPADPEQGG